MKISRDTYNVIGKNFRQKTRQNVTALLLTTGSNINNSLESVKKNLIYNLLYFV